MRQITIRVSNFPPNEIIEKEYDHFDTGESVITPEGIGIIAGNFEGLSYKPDYMYGYVYWGNPEYERYPVNIDGTIRMFYRKELKANDL